MKKLIVILSLFTCLAYQAKADVTINLGAGEFKQADGSTLMATNALLQIVVDVNGNGFTAPTPDSFTGNSDDKVLSSFALNAAAGPGTYQDSITFTLGGSFTTGKSMLLRWFPTLTPLTTIPGYSTAYGQFGTASALDGSDIGWVIPADGTYTLLFLTDTLGGSNSSSAGVASLKTAAPVPEPSTFALLGLGMGFAGWMARRKKA